MYTGHDDAERTVQSSQRISDTQIRADRGTVGKSVDISKSADAFRRRRQTRGVKRTGQFARNLKFARKSGRDSIP